jgi:hypothetical protein
MTDAEISRKLALAIGWPDAKVKTHQDRQVLIDTSDHPWPWCKLTEFRYTDPLVIWPISKRYKCFPYHSQFDRPGRQWSVVLGGKVHEAATPEMAVALAVIGGMR